MKLLVVLLSTMMAFSAFASSDNRDATQAAKADFNRLSATEAYHSNRFNKQVANIGLPGTSTWVKGTSLCVSGNMIQTKTAAYRQVCVEWSYRNSEGEKKTTTNVGTAMRFDGDCSRKVNGAKLESPINFTKQVNIWGARKDGATIKAIGGADKVFASRSKADDAGSPIVLGTKSVHVTVPTTYKVDYYRYTVQDRYNSQKHVGSHVYSVGQCN